MTKMLNTKQISDRELCTAVFGNGDTGARWEEIGLEFECPECKKEFELYSIEY
jgi:hypothetical protein